MHKLVFGYLNIVLLVLVSLVFPPLLVAVVPYVIWRTLRFRRRYREAVEAAQTDLRAQHCQAVTQHHMKVAKAWR